MPALFKANIEILMENLKIQRSIMNYCMGRKVRSDLKLVVRKWMAPVVLMQYISNIPATALRYCGSNAWSISSKR